jgi:hypothetical protein
MWAAYVEASNNGATAPASLTTYAADSALSTLNKGLATNHSNGVTSKGSPQISPAVAEASPPSAPTSVKILDCLDGTNWLLYKADGQLADNVPGGRRKITAQADLRPQGWRVTLIGIQGVGTCG